MPSSLGLRAYISASGIHIRQIPHAHVTTITRITHITRRMLFYILYVGITLSFSEATYEVEESAGSVKPVLVLSDPIDCCSTVSVWVDIKEISTDGKYVCMYATCYVHK